MAKTEKEWGALKLPHIHSSLPTKCASSLGWVLHHLEKVRVLLNPDAVAPQVLQETGEEREVLV